jgi:hypothetical protein
MIGSQRSRHKTCDILLPVSSAKNAQGQSFSFPPALVSSRCLDRQATPPPKLSDLQLASYTAAENEEELVKRREKVVQKNLLKVKPAGNFAKVEYVE